MNYNDITKINIEAALYFDGIVKKSIAEKFQQKFGRIIPANCWRDRLIYGFVEQAHVDYTELKRASDANGSLSTIAFHSRNLLELFVWVLHCLSDEKNIKSLYEDTAKDARELIEYFTKFTDSNTSDDFELIANKATASLADAAKKRGIESIEGSYQPVARVAALYPELDNYYKLCYKFLSKCAHPTALTIFGLGEEATQHFKFAFFGLGCLWFSASIRPLALDLGIEIDDPLSQGETGILAGKPSI